MLASMMVLLVGLLPQFGDVGQATATDDEVKSAKLYLRGKWNLVKLVDGGETIGPALIQRKLAKDALITIDNLTVHYSDPLGGDETVLAYRVNPAADPKQIDLINANSATFRGIYRFEGDSLSVCVNHENNGLRPTEFISKPGTKQQLFSLDLADSNPGPDQAPPVKVAAAAAVATEPVRPHPALSAPIATGTNRPQEDLFAAAPKAEIHRVTEVSRSTAVPDEVSSLKIEGPTGDVKVLSEVAIPTHDTERKATPGELQQAHDLLTGVWDITSVTDNGERYGAQLIQRKIAQDGKLIIGSRVVQMVSPDSGAKRISGYRINPATEPKQIDITTEFDNVKKGIYKFDGEDLLICLNNDPDSLRPTNFDAPTGSQRRSIRLHMADPTPPPAAEVPAHTAPTPEELAKQKQDTVRTMLVGSWVTSDSKGTVTTVLRPDGTFTTTREWSKAVKRLFEGDTSSASGRWSYENGLLRATILSSSDRKTAGQTFYGRIQSIGSTTMVAEDGTGSLKNYRKLR